MSAAPRPMISPFHDTARRLAERGISVMPCGPGTKFPGRYSDAAGWSAAYDWQKYCDKRPTHWETDIWERWPDAGICLALGRSSAPNGLQLVAIDIDTEEPDEVSAILSALPGSPVRKRGAKGETHFYLAPIDVPNRPYNNTLEPGVKRRMLDLLCHGRQTVLPPTIHPGTGSPYRWTTLDTLENFDVADLPVLPADIADRLSEALAPFGHVDPPVLGERDPDAEASTHRQLNDAALANLSAWVPALGLYKCRRMGDKYKAVPAWRPSSSGRPLSARATNLAIDRTGIKDCGEGKGYTPLNLVMAACDADLDTAFRWLQEHVAPAPLINLTSKIVVDDPEPGGEPRGNLSHLRLAASDGRIVQPCDVPREYGEDEEPVRGERGSTSDGAASPLPGSPNNPLFYQAIEALRTLRPLTQASLAAEHALSDVISGARRSASGGAVPVDLWQRHEAPDLPKGLLPPVIERFAFGHAEIMGADPAGLAMAALAVCAMAITDDITLQVKLHDPTWRESCRLWVGLVGDPSMKKSPTVAAALAPLRELDRELMVRNGMAMGEYMAIPKKDREAKPPPPQPQLIVQDTTPEAVQTVLKDSAAGILCFQDELSGWFGAMEKYNSGKGSSADRAFWLQAHGGGPYTVNRVGRGATFIPNLSVGILGGIQPDPLRKIAADSVDDGLIQRFIPVMLRTVSVGQDRPAGDEVDAYRSLVRRLAKLSPSRGPGDLASSRPVMLSTDARVIRERLEREHLELVVALVTVSPKLAAHFGKHDGVFARLCLLFHCAECIRGSAEPEISGETAERVARFMREFLRPSAIAFYSGILGIAAGHEHLMAVASLIVSERLVEVSARGLCHGLKAMRDVPAEDLRRLLERLEAFGWLDPIDQPRGRAPKWRVSPRVHEVFAERGRIEAERRAAAKAKVMEVFGR